MMETLVGGRGLSKDWKWLKSMDLELVHGLESKGICCQVKGLSLIPRTHMIEERWEVTNMAEHSLSQQARDPTFNHECWKMITSK